MKVYIVTSDGFNYDIPTTDVFDTRDKALSYIRACWDSWIEFSSLDMDDPFPDPNPERIGIRYMFHDGLNDEWHYLSEGVLQ